MCNGRAEARCKPSIRVHSCPVAAANARPDPQTDTCSLSILGGLGRQLSMSHFASALRVRVVAQRAGRRWFAVPVALLLVGSLAVQGASADEAAPAGPAVSVVVSGCPTTGLSVPADYLGLSIEWGMTQRWFGTSGHRTVAPMIALLRSLQVSPLTSGVLRVGGNSEDGYRWDPSGRTTANTPFTGTINAGMVDALLNVARFSGWKLVLGVNLRADQPGNAAALARYVVNHDTARSVIAFEMGNEPDSYFDADTTGYLARVRKYVAALDADPVTRGVPITGPALSNKADTGYVSAFAREFGSRMAFATWHHYANRPTITSLLDESVSRDWKARIAEVTLAAGGTPTRMAEGNSVGRGGWDHLSNVMASSTWLVDALLTGAEAGLAGFNLHSWDAQADTSGLQAFYTPFVIRRGRVVSRPSLFGLALLRNLPGSRFCQSATTSVATPPQGPAATSTATIASSPTATPSATPTPTSAPIASPSGAPYASPTDTPSAGTPALPAGTGIKGWAMSNSAGTHLFVYVVNKTNIAGAATISPPPDYSAATAAAATVSRITDPGGCGGRQTGINDALMPSSGRFSWTPVRIEPQAMTGAYHLDLGPCESALLDVTRSRG
ncbi:MAG: hypothetical protein NVS3B26_20380 [Mycobacteriales bacterium]